MSSSSKGRSGVLPVPGAVTRRNAVPQHSTRTSPKPASLRLRLIVRRLPPGLTEAEFWCPLGEEWAVGNGKTESATWKNGKVSKDPSKPSFPARAYLKAKEPMLLDELAVKIKETAFQDAKNTSKDPCLLGPPSLEFAPYNKTPGSRVRHDGRQGTIDQDQEFIDFLQSLTEPVTKATAAGSESAEPKPEKVKTTPLVQYIKDKKANKAKEAAAAKSAKKADVKDAKVNKSPSKTTVVVKNTTLAGEKDRLEKERLAKATQDAVKAINRSVASMPVKATTSKPDVKAVTPTPETAAPQARPPRERGTAIAANKILQRDLGIVSRDARSRRLPKTENAAASLGIPPKANVSLPAETTAKAAASSAVTPPVGPRNTTPSNGSVKTVSSPAQRPARAPPVPSAGAKSAFLKHANASQGVTEELLRTEFETFGVLTKCEIDKKKGFGYVDFEETEGLKKAMQASPIKVGNGQVVVLENRSRRPTNIISPAPGQTMASPLSTPTQPITPVSATSIAGAAIVAPAAPENKPNNAPQPIAPQTANTQPPTAPRGARRGAPINNRGGRGGYLGPGRGTFAPNRGAARAGFRGGRGNLPTGPGRGAGRGVVNASSPPPASAPPAQPATAAPNG